ncbi:RNA-binding protein [Candidatus Scalindua japonica]|uniref:RNA-binding protein n=1 Tax=Candidatus Scalindua japonica TaxID=1284222 RepID=A0A286TT76_9BACT|nr:RNA-binding protein [Candidatus Scalindua japonica]GAX59119.1 RNA-binding protein [Candidatus Scalindua japonica]
MSNGLQVVGFFQFPIAKQVVSQLFPYDGKVVNTEISEIKRKRRIQYLINIFELQ